MIHFKGIIIYMSSSLLSQYPDIEPLFHPQPKRMWFLVKKDDISLNNIELSEEEIKGTILALEAIVQEFKNDTTNWDNLRMISKNIQAIQEKLLSQSLHTRVWTNEWLLKSLMNTLALWRIGELIDIFELIIISANQKWIHAIARTWSIRDRLNEVITLS